MDPIAFKIGDFTVRWYGIMVALAFLSGFFLMAVRARKYQLNKENIADLLLFAMVGGILGARLLYVFRNWSEYADQLGRILMITEGGLVFYGGFIGGILTVVLACRLRHWPPANVADLAAPAIPLGHALGRIGCFLNGCCFGNPHSHFPNCQYPANSAASVCHFKKGLIESYHAVPLPVFPIQLVAAVLNLLICLILLGIERKKKLQGRLFPAYLVLYSIARFTTEFFRGDYVERGEGLTYTQWICILVFTVGIALIVIMTKRRTADKS